MDVEPTGIVTSPDATLAALPTVTPVMVPSFAVAPLATPSSLDLSAELMTPAVSAVAFGMVACESTTGVAAPFLSCTVVPLTATLAPKFAFTLFHRAISPAWPRKPM